MADTDTLPRISVGRWQGEGPHPGGEPVFWRCNRCNHLGDGCKNPGEAYQQAANHECPPVMAVDGIQVGDLDKS